MKRLRIPAALLSAALFLPACGADSPQQAPVPVADRTIGTHGAVPDSTQAPSMTFAALDGSPMSLQVFRGRAVLVNFWATWCGPCVKEMPWLAQVRERVGADRLEILGVATAEPDTAVVARFIRDNPVPYPIALDPDGVVADAFGGVYAMPTSFLLDAAGVIRYRFLGVIPEDAPMDSLVAGLAR